MSFPYVSLTCAVFLGSAGLILGCSCHAEGPPASLTAPATPTEPPLRPADRDRLKEAPFTELSFVPAGTEAIVRVDLAALVAAEPESDRMLGFLLRAQEPVVWEFLDAAGIAPGRELRALYLVVLGDEDASAFLLAGIGHIDGQRAKDALSRLGGVASAARGAATVFSWPRADATDPFDPAPVDGAGDPWVAVADGLLLSGPPTIVARALAARAGKEQDVRSSPLAREIVAVDASATAWGAAFSPRPDAALAALARGLARARFRATRPPSGPYGLELRAEFSDEGAARTFARHLEALLAAAATLGAGTPMGATMARLRASARFTVDGIVLSAVASL